MELMKKQIKQYLKRELGKEYITILDIYYSDYYHCYNVEYKTRYNQNGKDYYYTDLYRLTEKEYNTLKKGL